ncbi:SLAM family member 5-like protein [Turdus rufiventris]|nr:SLAM family member 5-like protein [Turdus rufiventris]
MEWENDDQSFNLTVYEAVPTPRTRSQLLASTLEWCNLTLQCQGSGRGAVNVTWRRDNLAWGELGPARGERWHQLSPDGTTLRVALPPAATNVTYACTVGNPADWKVARFELQELCQGGGDIGDNGDSGDNGDNGDRDGTGTRGLEGGTVRAAGAVPGRR